MKYRALTILFLLTFMMIASRILVAGEPASSYLSPMELEVLNELNLARTNPARYAKFLDGIRPFFNGNQLERPGEAVLITHEGVAAVDEAIGFLRSQKHLPPLTPSKGLSLAAKAHVKDQRDGALGHEGSDGSQPWDRMTRFGSWQGEVAENISYGAGNARGVVIQLIVDDGVPSRGHRINMFNPEYRFVGVGCGPHARFRDTCTMDFAAGYIEKNRR